MICDVNAYIGKWPYWPVKASRPADIAGTLSGWGIDTAAICSTRSIFVNWDDGNCETEQAAKQAPGTFVAFATIGTLELSHQLPRRSYDFENYAARGFRGVRLFPQHHSYHPLYEAFVDTVLEDAAARGWPVLLPLRLIMNWGMPMLELAVIEILVERHPKVNWILSGINYLWELQLAVHLMRRIATVHLETSCVMGYAAIEKLVEQCGAERLLFGSGAPFQHGAAALSKILHAAIDTQSKEQITSGNFRRLVGAA